VIDLLTSNHDHAQKNLPGVAEVAAKCRSDSTRAIGKKGSTGAAI
jgi:hypothetical protein